MKKIDKIKNLEAARVLLIHAQGMVDAAIRKINEIGPSGIDSAMASESVQNALVIVKHLQSKTEEIQRKY
jgi:hypothetical protein